MYSLQTSISYFNGMSDHGSTFAADATDSLVKREKMRYNNSSYTGRASTLYLLIFHLLLAKQFLNNTC